jgi:general L-amino acid transport system permease protein
VVAVLLLSVAAAWYFGRWARARQAATGRILPVFWVRLAILAIPVLAAFFAMGSPVSLELPALKGFNFKGGIYMRDSLIGLWLALSVYTGAFIAEIVRAGILAISKGQTEAAHALGLRPGRTMSLVILPQALRVIVPPLISQFLNLTKNSSLAVAIGYQDIVSIGDTILNQSGQALEVISLYMAFYLVLSLLTSAFMNWYNKRIALVER